MDLDEKMTRIRASYEAFSRKDVEALILLYPPDCEWCMSNWAGWPEEPLYVGRQGLVELFNVFIAPWDDFHPPPPAPVRVLTRARARGERF
jgi:ketosteroid isomerase-like protein